MPSIQILNAIAQQGLDQFDDNYQLSDNVTNPEAILLRSAKLPADAIADSVEVIGRAGAGTNNIDVASCSERGIVVMNAPGANANAVKELVITGMLLACRNICAAWDYTRSLEADDQLAKTVETNKKRFKGVELPGRTLGIIGLGHIGVKVANAAVALGMNVIGFDPAMTVQNAWMLSAEVKQADSIAELLPQVDFLTVHVPLIDATRNLLDAKEFAQVKSGLVLLNFAREGIVNNDAVIAALGSEQLSHYVCDFPSGELQGNDKVISLPHLGASTEEAETNCAVMVARQVKDFLENGTIYNSVNFPNVKLARHQGTRLCIVNRNVPNMVAQISSLLADSDANIVDMVNRSRGDIAYSLIDIDRAPSDELIQQLLAIDGIVKVRCC